MIPMSDLKNGYLYKIKSRNLILGVWDEKKKGFVGIREKFGSRFLFMEIHWDADKHFGTAKPLEELEECPISDKRESIGTICGQCEEKFGLRVPVAYLPFPDGPKVKTYYHKDEQFKSVYSSGWQHTTEDGKCDEPFGRSLGNDALFDWLDAKEHEQLDKHKG